MPGPKIEGREPLGAEPATERTVRSAPWRRAAAGRRLPRWCAGLDDADLERRFAEPRRQRALVRATARGFQPAQAGGFSGTIAYEIEPHAIEPPPGAPGAGRSRSTRGAGTARAGRAGALDAAVTIHIGLAEWVRVMAALQAALAAMVAGRCSVEGDVVLAVRLEAMFGGG